MIPNLEAAGSALFYVLLQLLPCSVLAAQNDLRQALHDAVAKINGVSKVPGISVAVIRDRKLYWAAGFGLKAVPRKRAEHKTREDKKKKPVSDAATNRVDTDTLFQAASISKPITALAVMRMVAAGKLDLDRPITKVGEWSLPYDQKLGEQRANLRHFLSHTAGATVHGFGGYRPEQTIPDLVAVLEGKGNSAKVEIQRPPGAAFRYSGGGYCVVQLQLTTVAAKTFPDLMHALVLKPAGMVRSTFDQPLPKARRREAAQAHDEKGAPYDVPWMVYPEMAAAGLWTTPTDLARAMIAVDAARRGEKGALLSKKLAAQMLSSQPNATGSTLGWQIGEIDGETVFRHGGSNEGFKCGARFATRSGTGIVVMINSDRGRAVGQVRKAVLEVLATNRK